jgi:ADP-heptose:LPS heptosyltransferase
MARADRRRRAALDSVFGRRMRAIQAQLCRPGGLPADGIFSILVIRPNHRLGNTVLISPLLRELEALYPGAEIDILASGGAAQVLFSTRFQVHRVETLARRMPRHPVHTLRLLREVCKRRYDLAIDASMDSNMGRLILGRCQASHKLSFPLEDSTDPTMAPYREQCPAHFALRNVHLLRTASGRRATDAWPRLNVNLSPAERERGQQALGHILGVGADTPRSGFVLGVFANATADKRYPGDWWSTFMQTLDPQAAGITVVDVLADHGRSQLPGESHPFYSRDLRKLGSVLAAMDAFISADCGVMHLASAVDVPTLGLFSRDNSDKYAPYGGHNIALDTREGVTPRDAARQAGAWLEHVRGGDAWPLEAEA